MTTAAAPDPDLAGLVARVELELEARLPQRSKLAPSLIDAMRYSALSGGKRLRGALVCGTALSLGAPLELALAPAVAVELLHCYSLIHDDLPAMDDDTLRRGNPTCHVQFDEATAILAGDALQALAFEVIATATDISAEHRCRMLAALSEAAGWQGMVGGQVCDMASTGEQLDLNALKALHGGKTGALFMVSCQLGALSAESFNAASSQHPDRGLTQIASHWEAVTRFGTQIGLAFQVVDDILDETQTAEVLGKTPGKDAVDGKNTYPGIMGLNAAMAYAHDLLAAAKASLEDAGIADGPLFEIADATVNRIS